MWFCDECGAPTEGGEVAAGEPPHCAVHGPRWRLVRNAPCAGVIIVRDELILLGKRAKDPYAGWWEVPGGFVERGEHPSTTAVREVREELGIEVVLTGLVGVYLETSGRGEQLQVTVYVGTTDAVDCTPDPAEVSDWAWFHRDEVPQELAGRHRLRIDDYLEGRTVHLPADGLGRPDPTTIA